MVNSVDNSANFFSLCWETISSARPQSDFLKCISSMFQEIPRMHLDLRKYTAL